MFLIVLVLTMSDNASKRINVQTKTQGCGLGHRSPGFKFLLGWLRFKVALGSCARKFALIVPLSPPGNVNC